MSINYVRRFIYRQRIKHKRRKTLKRKLKRLRAKKERKSKLSIISELDGSTTSIEDRTLNEIVVDNNSNNSSEEIDGQKGQAEHNGHSNETFFEQQNNMDEDYLTAPSRRGFFLYTIDEHETLTNKMFTVRRKMNIYSASSLSKSDTNLSKIKY